MGKRWIRPKPDVLKKIIDAREAEKINLMKFSGHRSSSNKQVTNQMHSDAGTAFLNIVPDNEFPKRSPKITKQVYCIKPECETPQIHREALEGLRLPPPNANHLIQFTVFKMSESIGRKYGLYLKPRKRRRKKNNKNEDTEKKLLEHRDHEPMEVETIETKDSDDEAELEIANTTNNICSMKISGSIGTNGNAEMIRTTAPMTMNSYLPYNSTVLLPQINILYNSKGLFKGGKLLRSALAINDMDQRGISLCHGILLQNVHLKDKSIGNSSYSFFSRKISKMLGSNELDDLNFLIKRIIKFHSKKKWIVDRLVEGCSKPWIKPKKPNYNNEQVFLGLDDSVVNSQTGINFKEKKLMMDALSTHVPVDAVIGGISTIIRISGCKIILGSRSNLRRFLKFVRKFILAGLYSNFYLGQLMYKLDYNDCKLFPKISDSNFREHLFAKLVNWLFCEYTLGLLRAGFYITEFQDTRYEIRFFFQSKWRLICKEFCKRLINRKQLVKLKSKPSKEKDLVCKGRLIPKKHDVRLILCNNKKKSNPAISRKMAQTLSLLLKSIAPHCVKSESEILGMWNTFIAKWRANGSPKLHYIKCDVKDAYPSVDIQFLALMLKNYLSDFGKKFRIEVTQYGKFKNPRLIDPSNSTNKIFNSETFCAEDIINMIINEIEKPVLVQINSHVYKFFFGLPQGAPCSQALCNIYYGNMDNANFSDLIADANGFFVRTVDDYLFISDNPLKIWDFHQRIRYGIKSHRCYFKGEKTKSNIYVSSVNEISEEEYVTFFGWRLSLITGQVSRDFGSYAGTNILSSLSFKLSSYESSLKFLERRLLAVKPLRLNRYLLSSSLNCKWRIIKTIFEAALMMAFRFCSASKILLYNISDLNNPEIATVLCNSIGKLIKQVFIKVRSGFSFGEFNTCIKDCCKCKKRLEDGIQYNLQAEKSIDENEVRYIVYLAFFLRLKHRIPVVNGGILHKLKVLMKYHRKRYKNQMIMNLDCKKLPKHFQKILK